MTRGMVRLIVAVELVIALSAMLWPIDKGSAQWAVTVGSEEMSVEAVGGGENVAPIRLLIEGTPEPLIVDGVELEHPAATALNTRLLVAAIAGATAAVGWAILKRGNLKGSTPET